MATKSMTALTKDRLKESVHDVTILADEGMHPTSALAKVAQSLNLTDDQIRLVGRAFNTATTAETREKGATILEKLATTPIADCEEAVRLSQSAKTASLEPVAPVYSIDRNLAELKGLSAKVASELDYQDWVKTASATKPEVKKEISTDKLISDRRFLDSQIDKLAGQAEILKNRLNGDLHILQKYANKCQPSVQLATKIAAVQKYGKEILPLIDHVLVVSEPDFKLASVNADLMAFIGDIANTSRQLMETVEVLNKTAQCRNIITAQLEKRGNTGTGLSSMMTKYLLLDKIFNKGEQKEQSTNSSNILPSRYVQNGIVTPDHKRRMDNIAVKSMVNDMLANDDIIGQYSPDEVYSVFNELKATSPKAMLRPGVAKSFVREALAKGNLLGSYDLNPLMGYEKDLQKETI